MGEWGERMEVRSVRDRLRFRGGGGLPGDLTRAI